MAIPVAGTNACGRPFKRGLTLIHRRWHGPTTCRVGADFTELGRMELPKQDQAATGTGDGFGLGITTSPPTEEGRTVVTATTKVGVLVLLAALLLMGGLMASAGAQTDILPAPEVQPEPTAVPDVPAFDPTVDEWAGATEEIRTRSLENLATLTPVLPTEEEADDWYVRIKGCVANKECVPMP